MTLAAIKQLVEQVRYKPGWRINAEINKKWNDVIIRIDVKTRNARGKGYVLIRNTQWATTTTTRSAILLRIQRAIKDVERHEFGEWYRVGRERPFDPH